MKAAVCEKYGPPEVLKVREIEKPTPKKGELLIKVRATSVNSGDVRLRALRVDDGSLGSVVKLAMRLIVGVKGPRRKVLGSVLAGTVEEFGEDVDGFEVGDEVYAMTGLKFGAFAEYATLSQKKAVTLKPKKANFEQAASIPFGGTTALYFLRKAGIEKAKKVLIYGSSGAVGTAALQVAKYYGADITAICGKDGMKLSKELGASKVYDYKKDKITDLTGRYDAIFDAVGKISKKEAKHLLSEGGQYVTVAGMDVAKELTSDLKQLATMYDEGSFKAVIDRTYSLDDIVDANRYVDIGHKKGSVVIAVVQ